MTERIKIYTNGSDKILAKDEIEAIEIKESNNWSKDVLIIQTIDGKGFPLYENESVFLKHFDRTIRIYSSGKYLNLIPRHISGVERLEDNTFSKDKLRINLKSGKSYVVYENLRDFEKKL